MQRNDGQQQEEDGLLAGKGEGGDKSMSYWEIAKVIYQELVFAIIRPPRAAYNFAELGPEEFTLGGKSFVRTDVELMNKRSHVLQCSYWEPENHEPTPPPCIIYLHGNSSCRVESIEVLSACLSRGLTVFSFDFSGSGHSEGEYVSLGYYEREDLKVVADFLLDTGVASCLGVWGRSMGAVTALLHGGRAGVINAMVLDSPFSDLEKLALELCTDKERLQGSLGIPSLIARFGLSFVRSSVKQKADFSISECSPLRAVQARAEGDAPAIPALFTVAEDDELIPPRHSHTLFEHYPGYKLLLRVAGGHSSARPETFYDIAAMFLVTVLMKAREGARAEREGGDGDGDGDDVVEVEASESGAQEKAMAGEGVKSGEETVGAESPEHARTNSKNGNGEAEHALDSANRKKLPGAKHEDDGSPSAPKSPVAPWRKQRLSLEEHAHANVHGGRVAAESGGEGVAGGVDSAVAAAAGDHHDAEYGSGVGSLALVPLQAAQLSLAHCLSPPPPPHQLLAAAQAESETKAEEAVDDEYDQLRTASEAKTGSEEIGATSDGPQTQDRRKRAALRRQLWGRHERVAVYCPHAPPPGFCTEAQLGADRFILLAGKLISAPPGTDADNVADGRVAMSMNGAAHVGMLTSDFSEASVDSARGFDSPEMMAKFLAYSQLHPLAEPHTSWWSDLKRACKGPASVGGCFVRGRSASHVGDVSEGRSAQAKKYGGHEKGRHSGAEYGPGRNSVRSSAAQQAWLNLPIESKAYLR